jgi:hypothetical protein
MPSSGRLIMRPDARAEHDRSVSPCAVRFPAF